MTGVRTHGIGPTLIVLAAGLGALGCGSRAVSRGPARPQPAATLAPGDCGEPGRDGVLGASPRIDRADRDLDGDGTAETVAVDRRMCTADGNCYWNLFSGRARGGCRRYLGTIAATGIEPLDQAGDDGFLDLRGWWKLSGGRRYLLQQYRFQAGSYRIVDALVCRQEGDDRLLCADDRDSVLDSRP